MVLYEYRCPECGNLQEETHSMDDKPEIKCERCKKLMYKKIGGAAFMLRGEGWSKDGYQSHVKIRRGLEYDSYKSARNAHENKHGKTGGNK